MSIFILVVGLIILAIAISFLVKYHCLKTDVRAIRATETSNIADLRAMQLSIAESIGRNGTWKERVEVKGLVVSNRPLTAELSKIPCIFCHTTIKEEYERTEYDTDDDGNTETKQVKGTKTISNHQNRVNFYLEDETDKIFVNPEGAEIDGLTVVNEFESRYRERNRDYRIFGYHRTEKIIELNSKVYILGEVKDIDGRLQIGAGSDRQTPFLISYRSETELIEQKQRLGRRKLLWGICLSLIGLSMITYSLWLLVILT